MSNITIKFKDGRVRKFEHEGRAGGSYSKALSHEGAFAIVTDEWGQRFSFPAEDIEEILEEPIRRPW